MYTYSMLPFHGAGKSRLEKKTAYLLNMIKPGHTPLLVMRYYRITEPQNHRAWIWPLEITLPKSKSKCSFPTFILHRKASIWVLNIIKEEESTTSLGTLFQCSADLTVIKLFLMFVRNFVCCNFCLFPLLLSLYITEKSPAQFIWLPHIRYL